MFQTVTTEPTAITGLTDGDSYLFQNRSDYEIFIEEGASAPDVNSLGATALTPRGGNFDHVPMEKGSKDIYVWTHYVGGSTNALSIGVVR